MQPTFDGMTLLKLLGLREYQIEVLTQQLAQANAKVAELTKTLGEKQAAAPQ